jgi:Uma2 family endonuclease
MRMATTWIQIGPAEHGRVMTPEEFRAAEEEEGYRYELARGVLEVADLPDDFHRQVVFNLYLALFRHQGTHFDLIHCIGGVGEIRLRVPGLISIRTPDVAIVLENTPQDARGFRPPALAVEVVSKGGETRDYVTKRQEYLAYGLREYWIVDPHTRRVTVLSRDGDVWVERVFQGVQKIESRVLPSFAGRVADLWLDAEIEADPDENA